MSKLMVAVVSAALLMLGWPAHAAPADARVVNSDSSGPTVRFDVAGNAVDAHDGEIQRFGNEYFLYGTSYGCGYEWQTPGAPFCGFHVYSSPDLEHWTDRGPLFDAKTATWQGRCNGSTYGCYRPHVVYNESTRRYVLWVNTYDVSVGYHVFTSKSPTGPFVEQAVPTLSVNGDVPPGVNNGDHDVFVDRDGTAYLAFTDWRNSGEIVVEELDRTYLTGTGRSVRVGTRSTEAPSMFRRGDRYYLTYSDPNCGYCTTGTSYLTADSPLGPWTGSGSSPDTWTIEDGALRVVGGVGLSKAGADWSDYTLSARVTPETAGIGGYAQAGWYFRATGTGTGYAWLLGNYPHPGATQGSLTKVVYRNGTVLSAKVVPLPFPVVTGHAYDVSTEASGSTLTTTIDGVTVDTTEDSTHATGRVGFRESGGSDQEVGVFDDVRVTAPDGTVLLSDDFSDGLGQWERPAPVITGTKLSTTSCGGQPADVAELPARGGPVYLYQSDLWNKGAANEALALHHWEPLRFTDDGEILPLECGRSYSLPLAGVHAGPPAPPAPPGTVTTGDVGFRPYCDIARNVQRAQTFTVTRSGLLDEVRFTTSQSGHPDVGVDLTLTRVTSAGAPGTVVTSGRVQPGSVSWSPSWVTLDTAVPVEAGDRFAIVVSSSTTAGCYGMAYSDGDPYAAGGGYYSSDGGQTWRPETGRDLHVRATVRATR
jgi:hypothetical protein